MMKNVKQKILNTATASFGASMLIFASSTMALPAFPTGGTCAMLVSHGSPEGATMPITIAYSTLATVDFNIGTIYKETTKLTYDLPGPTAVPPTITTATKTFSVGPGSFGTSSRILTVNTTPVDKYNVIAVNGGSTLLVQGITNPSNGVCQF